MSLDKQRELLHVIICYVKGVSANNIKTRASEVYCKGVLSLAILMFALIRSKSSAVEAMGDGCRFL